MPKGHNSSYKVLRIIDNILVFSVTLLAIGTLYGLKKDVWSFITLSFLLVSINFNHMKGGILKCQKTIV